MHNCCWCLRESQVLFQCTQDSDGQEWDEPYDICVWTAGARASEMAQSLDFKTNSQGRITVTPRLQVGIIYLRFKSSRIDPT